jgi:bidirectional [NiFe] hydrogenase diaphorase subunit
MHGILTKLSEKRATRRDLVVLDQLCDLTRHASLCGLGQSAPNPVLSTLRYFGEEYEAALVDADSQNGQHGQAMLAETAEEGRP